MTKRDHEIIAVLLMAQTQCLAHIMLKASGRAFTNEIRDEVHKRIKDAFVQVAKTIDDYPDTGDGS